VNIKEVHDAINLSL